MRCNQKVPSLFLSCPDFSDDFFSLQIKEKKKRDRASIHMTSRKHDLTKAPCAVTPSTLTGADFLDLWDSRSPQAPVDSTKPCSSTPSVTRSLLDLVLVTL